MRVNSWNPKAADEEIYAEAMDRLEKAANAVKRRARAACPVGKSRPMYKTGRFANKPWTAREAGALKKTIRVVRKYGDRSHNVWVMAGNKDVFYAQIVEYRTPFLRPSLAGSKSEIATIISNGTTAKGGTF